MAVFGDHRQHRRHRQPRHQWVLCQPYGSLPMPIPIPIQLIAMHRLCQCLSRCLQMPSLLL